MNEYIINYLRENNKYNIFINDNTHIYFRRIIDLLLYIDINNKSVKRNMINIYIDIDSIYFSDISGEEFVNLLNIKTNSEKINTSFEESSIFEVMDYNEQINIINSFFDKLTLGVECQSLENDGRKIYRLITENANYMILDIILATSINYFYENTIDKELMSEFSELLIHQTPGNFVDKIEDYLKSSQEYKEIQCNSMNRLKKGIIEKRQENCLEDIHSYDRELKSLIRRINSVKIKLRTANSLLESIAQGLDNFNLKPLIDFVKISKDIIIDDVQDSAINVTILSKLSVWKDSYLDTIKENNYNCEFIDQIRCRYEYSRDTIIKFFKMVFVDREIDVKTYASFNIDFEDNDIQKRFSGVEREYNETTYLPNIHIGRYDCWSEAYNVAMEFLNELRLVEMMSMLIQATQQINLMDTTVMGDLARMMCECKCLEYNEEMYSGIQILDMLENEKEEENEE